jgi:hypothetical protein
MKTITISDEAAEFFKRVSNAIRTQDNRGTAEPYFITIQKKVERGVPDGCGIDTRYFDNEQCELYDYESIKERAEEMELNVEEYIDKYCQKYDIREFEEYENFFLTYEGYNAHINSNGHNIARTCKSYQNYVQYACRNPELESLYEFIHEIADAL